jgi:glycosyltransferase involved in cell wall biosynthesis
VSDIVYVTFEDTGGMLHYATNLAEAAGTISSVGIALFSEKKIESSSFSVEYTRLSKPTGKGLIGRVHKYDIFHYKEKAKELIKWTQPKIVHMTSFSVCLYSFARTLSMLGVKTIYTMHDPEMHEEKITLWGKIFAVYQRKYQFPRVFQVVDAIHVHSIKHLNMLVNIYGNWIEKKTYVVQHGGGIPKTIKNGSQSPPELKKLNSKNCCLLFFGRVHPYKGLNVLDKAIRIVRRRGYKITLILAGQGDLDTLFNKDINGDIIINRFIGDQEVGRLFETADVVVLPYLSATQSGVIPLAYAYGKPVICTKVGALDELVADGETGLLVKAQDDEALADAIISLANKDIRQRMGNAARQYIEAHIDWQQIAAKHIEVYQKLVIKNGKGVSL